jgi:hypothetical protein
MPLPRSSTWPGCRRSTPRAAQPARPRPGHLAAAAAAWSGPACALLWALAPAAVPLPAAAQTINVSALVTGTLQRVPTSSLNTPCGSACSWATVSGAAHTGTFGVDAGPRTIAGWPGVWAAARPEPHDAKDDSPVVYSQTNLPEVGLAPAPLNLAEVRFDSQLFYGSPVRHVSTETFRVGAGMAAMAYSVRISNISAAPQAQWLEFQVPKYEAWLAEAKDEFAGPGSNETIFKRAEIAMRRASVDVIIDGLPVWSSEQRSVRPTRLKKNPADFDLSTGPALNGTGIVRLFLGQVPAKTVLHATLLLRVDGRIQAPACLYETLYDPIHGNTSFYSCHAERLRLNIPAWLESSVGGGTTTWMRPAMRVVLN